MQVASHEENQQLAALAVAVVAALFLVIFGCSINSIWYQAIYGWILDSKVFAYSLRTPKNDFGRRSYGRPKLEDTTRKSGAPNQQGPTVFYHFQT